MVAAAAPRGQGVGGHARPKVGAADADVHHVGDGLAGAAFHIASAHALGEGADAAQFGVHELLHRVAPGCLAAGGAGRAAQGGVQHGAPFAGVDGVAPEHGVALGGHLGLVGEFDEGVPHGAVQRLAAVVELDAGAFGTGLHLLFAARAGQAFAQVGLGRGGQGGELLPGGECGG